MPIQAKTTHFSYAKRQTILFVGGPSSFPDVYLRLIASEFENTDVAILPSFSAAKTRLAEETDAPFILVFSSRSAHAETDTLIELTTRFSRFQPVLAFLNASEIGPTIDIIGEPELMARLSFLALRSRIDTAINIFRLLISGERHICGEVMDNVLSESGPSQKEQKADFVQLRCSLTARETEVLGCLSKGESNKIIAHHLQLSESTIKLHIHNIIGKMGVSNRTEAAIAYVAAAHGGGRGGGGP